MAVTIRYETHSLTEDNKTGHATGWLPGRLSAQGRELARAIGPRGLADGATAVFVSDLARAVETAELAFGDNGLPIIRDARLRECNYGAQNGMPVAQLAASRAHHIDEPYPEGQSYRAVVAATRSFLRDLAAGYDGRTVVVIAHSANKWALANCVCSRNGPPSFCTPPSGHTAAPRPGGRGAYLCVGNGYKVVRRGGQCQRLP